MFGFCSSWRVEMKLPMAQTIPCLISFSAIVNLYNISIRRAIWSDLYLLIPYTDFFSKIYIKCHHFFRSISRFVSVKHFLLFLFKFEFVCSLPIVIQLHFCTKMILTSPIHNSQRGLSICAKYVFYLLKVNKDKFTGS